MMIVKALTKAVVLLLLASSNLPAQVGVINATAVGTVVDEKGGVLPGVTVRITNTGTNVTQQGITDDRGDYRIANLPPGPYRLEAELTGFKTAVVTDIKLEVAQTARYNL